MMNPSPSQPTLGTVANKIRTHDPHAALRLDQLEQAVSGSDPSASAWANTNVHQVIGSTGIPERLRASQAAGQGVVLPRWVSYLEWIRNFLVLVPLVITWLGISVAVAGYHDLLQADPNGDDAFLPFLALWQDGFNGHLFLDLTLSKLAIFDFSILSAVVILTATVSWFAHVRQGKADVAAERAETAARKLEADLDHVLASASLQLAARRAGQPGNFVDRFEEAARELLKFLEEERQQLHQWAADKAKELDTLNVLTPALKDAAKEIQEAVAALATTNTNLTTTLDKANKDLRDTVNLLITPATEISTQQQQLLPIAQGTFNRLEDVSTKQRDLISLQQQLGQELPQVLDALNQTAKQSLNVANQMSNAVNQHAQFLQKLEVDLHTQRDLASTVDTAATGLKEGLDSINQCAISLRGIASEMDELVNRMVQLPSKLDTDLFAVLKEHSEAAAKIGAAGETLAKVPGLVDQWLRYWDSKNGPHN